MPAIEYPDQMPVVDLQPLASMELESVVRNTPFEYPQTASLSGVRIAFAGSVTVPASSLVSLAVALPSQAY